MPRFNRILIGWRLSLSSIRYVLRDKSLLYFPLTSSFLVLLTLTLFYIAVGPDKMKLIINTRFNDLGVQYINYGYYFVALMAYLGLAITTMLMNAALIACADRTMQGEDTSYKQGLIAAFRRAFGVIPWALISSTIGLLFTLLDQERRCSTVLRNWFGASWSTLTYFVLPVMVIDKRNVISAFRHSKKLMQQTWGENLQPRFGLFWLLLLLNTPLIVVALLLYFSEWSFNNAIILLMMLYVGIAVLLAQTARAVLNVALHHFASDRVVEGFNMNLLRDAFRCRTDITEHTEPEDHLDTEDKSESAGELHPAVENDTLEKDTQPGDEVSGEK